MRNLLRELVWLLHPMQRAIVRLVLQMRCLLRETWLFSGEYELSGMMVYARRYGRCDDVLRRPGTDVRAAPQRRRGHLGLLVCVVRART
jgi:hypothetical protein